MPPGDGAIPYFSSVVSHDWERLGYPNIQVAPFWDTRSCGVACLCMTYGCLTPGIKMLPARVTEQLLRLGAYTEAGGWNHLGLARHARRRGLAAHLVTLGRPDDLWKIANTAGVLIVSIGSSFESDGDSGHLAVVAGFSDAGHVVIHRPSGLDPLEGYGLEVDPDTFWAHFSGRGIHISL